MQLHETLGEEQNTDKRFINDKSKKNGHRAMYQSIIIFASEYKCIVPLIFILRVSLPKCRISFAFLP
jgi:hypothetical protein